MLGIQDLNPHQYVLSDEAQANQEALFAAVSSVEEAFVNTGSLPFSVTSGVRSWDDHVAIYDAINVRRAEVNLAPLRIPTQSNHLVEIAAAVDIADSNKQLWAFCLINIPMLEELGIYLEQRQGGWVHMQILPPASGKRIFNP